MKTYGENPFGAGGLFLDIPKPKRKRSNGTCKAELNITTRRLTRAVMYQWALEQWENERTSERWIEVQRWARY